MVVRGLIDGVIEPEIACGTVPTLNERGSDPAQSHATGE